ncbi:hypothetical protein [Hymenobacter koreensis]|uniref:YcxB family protein n=1 Tax=Hymenobacter koreensis TaxID=1084523 RepID=A0ABP8IVI8_9BACT
MIEIKEVIIPKEDYVQINSILLRQKFWAARSRLLIYAGLVVLVVLRFAAAYWQYADTHVDPPILLGLMLLGLLSMPWFLLRRMKIMVLKQFAASLTSRFATTFQLSDAIIVSENQVARTEINWSTVHRAWHYGNWLLLFVGDNGALYLDINRLVPPSQTTDLLQLLNRKGIYIK